MFNAKKIATVIAAAALMMGVSTSAFAAFTGTTALGVDLVRVVLQQNGGTTEIGTDLGDVTTALAGGTFGGGADAFTAKNGGTNFVAGTTGLNVVYFAVNQTTKELWITGVTPSISAGKSVSINSLSTAIYNYYNGIGGTTVLADASASTSYRVKADSTTQFGQFGTAILAANRPYTEANLAALATGGSVTQDLYYFKDYSKASAGVKLNNTIITNANGSTTITATPIPAAIYLMGSGLLGLVGLRRRKEA